MPRSSSDPQVVGAGGVRSLARLSLAIWGFVLEQALAAVWDAEALVEEWL